MSGKVNGAKNQVNWRQVTDLYVYKKRGFSEVKMGRRSPHCKERCLKIVEQIQNDVNPIISA